MSWIALGNGSAAASEITEGQHLDALGTELMVRGSIVVDFDFSLRQKAPCKLVSFRSDRDWARRFTIFLNADYSLSVEAQQGSARCYARLSDINLREAGAVRLTYAWDAPEKRGLLCLECAGGGSIHQKVIEAPIPMPLADAIAIVRGSPDTAFDERTRALALCDTVVPVGPAPSIAKGALVETTQGARRIEKLRLGDMVLTKEAGAQPVRWIVQQDLPTMGRSAPIRLRAPFFGLTKDLVVAADQLVLISGNETEYHFGQETVLIEAKNLVAHPAAGPLGGALSMTYYQVLLDCHDCIRVCGAWADSLYVGHLAMAPGVVATTLLADMPSSIMPVHRSPARPALRGYERQALLESLTG